VLLKVMDHLFTPMLYTSLTSAVGFASLAFTPIPPVRVFGIFIGLGVVIAWLGTLTVLPAVLTLVKEESIARAVGDRDGSSGRFAAAVRALPTGAARRRVPVLVAVGAVALASVPAMMQIQVNDNPVNWFRADHEVRVASERLNDELPGTFAANLVLTADDDEQLLDPATIDAVAALQDEWGRVDVIGDARGGDAAAALDAALARSELPATLITAELDRANLRLQLRDGDNQAMAEVLDRTEVQLAAMPLPDGVTAEWGGETYLNLVWQEEMVEGMIVGFALTLVIILALLTLLFRSITWALLACAPVLWTIAVVYGVIGAIGKDFDMPIAVLSTLVLGIGVDFAIHFVERYRELLHELGSPGAAISAFAEEPARALTRNAAVIAIGFTPLLFSSLTPYVIVGLFLASIIVLSWLATVVALPAAVGRARAQ